jgi:hypothetical protein
MNRTATFWRNRFVCLVKPPKIPTPAAPAPAPPPPEKTVESLDLEDEFANKYMGARKSINKLKINMKQK